MTCTVQKATVTTYFVLPDLFCVLYRITDLFCSKIALFITLSTYFVSTIDYSLSYSQICNVDYATRKIKSLGNSCNEKDFMNIKHIKAYMRDNLCFAGQPKDGFIMEDLNIMLVYFCVIN